MKTDAKTTYAQSSAIEARSRVQYRKDMKKKAIAELELLDWLQAKMGHMYAGQKVTVTKTGGDAFLWFLRKGGLSGEADFEAKIGDRTIQLEFQYAEETRTDFYDFTLSKVGRKKAGERIPYKDKKFIYILKPERAFAFIDPEWIMQNGKVAEVAAWRRDAYRVPAKKLQAVLRTDASLEGPIRRIDIKNEFLSFQHSLLESWKDQLAYLFQSVVDAEKIVRIVPRDLDSFFKVAFILENLDRTPTQAPLWLVYLLSYADGRLDSETIAKIMYCLGFLYFRMEPKENELKALADKINLLQSLVSSMEQQDGTYRSSTKISPLEEIRDTLFSVNLLEDITQDAIYYYGCSSLSPVRKIFQMVSHPEKTYALMSVS